MVGCRSRSADGIGGSSPHDLMGVQLGNIDSPNRLRLPPLLHLGRAPARQDDDDEGGDEYAEANLHSHDSP